MKLSDVVSYLKKNREKLVDRAISDSLDSEMNKSHLFKKGNKNASNTTTAE